jgi:formylglycine-generating enzyme required for sulfatase activity
MTRFRWVMCLTAVLSLVTAVWIGWKLIGSRDIENVRVNDQTPRIGKEITNSLNMKFIRIPAGKFIMGCPKDESKQFDGEMEHEVEITRPFLMGVHEVTQEQYERVMGNNPSWFSESDIGRDMVKGMDTKRFPVETVSWDDAQEFCKKLSEREEEKKAGRSYRLPTEAEWEYACRGGATTHSAYSFGSTLSPKQANFSETGLQRPCPVGSYPANAFGLFDMHGNVWEWCQDYYGPYDLSQKKDPTGPKNVPEERRVLRGGGWRFDGFYCRSAHRNWYIPIGHHYSNGFRVICVVRAP